MKKTIDKSMNTAARPPSQAVVERVAACEGVDPIDVSPLHEVINPGVLDRLVQRREWNDTVLQIEFTYHGYNVTVTGDGVVHLARQEDSEG